MTEWFVAPSLNSLLASVNVEFPNRDKSSDGSIGDASHAARASEHNPCWTCTGYQYGIVRARDFDIDDGNPGRDLRKEILASCIGHPAVWYVISNGVIYSRTHNWEARAYTGPNGHFHHVHVSINKDERSAKDLSLKLKALVKPGGGGSDAKPPVAGGNRFDIHPSRIRNMANGFKPAPGDPAIKEVEALLDWFEDLTVSGGAPILFRGGLAQWQRAIRQGNYVGAGKLLKAAIVNYQKRYKLVPDGVFGPKSAAIAGGKTGRFDIIGK